MTVTTVETLDQFIEDARALHSQGLAPADLWRAMAEPLGPLLADETLKDMSADWPVSDHENLLFYQDPDYGFVVNGLIKAPGQKTRIHDHAHIWTLYGVLVGHETIYNYDRIDDGSREDYAEIKLRDEIAVTSGDYDLVAPYAVHAEISGPNRSVAIIIRSEKSGGFLQGRYEPDTNRYWQGLGVTQIPYPLA